MRLVFVFLIIFIMVGCKSNNEYEVNYHKALDEIVMLKQEIKVNEDELLLLSINQDSLKLNLEDLEQINDKLEAELNFSKESYAQLLEEKENSKEFDRWNYELHFINANSEKKSLTYFIEEKELNCQTVNIIGSEIDLHGESYEVEQTYIKGLGDNELVKFIVFGSIWDFELYELNYSDGDWENPEYTLIESVGDLKNEEIIIETMLPEGLPSEVVRWKDSYGNVYEEYLSYDGLGASGRMILSN